MIHELVATATGADHAQPGTVRFGGDARADATGSTRHGTLNVTSNATGGSFRGFGSPNSMGGGAIATASGSHSGAGALNVEARARGFSGEADSVGAFAEGTSTGGGFDELVFSVEVFGQAFDGPHTFGSLAEANSFFASLIGLGSAFGGEGGSSNSPAVRVLFDITSHAGSGWGANLIQAF